jgi:DNA-binding MarR family transcriptional regulator
MHDDQSLTGPQSDGRPQLTNEDAVVAALRRIMHAVELYSRSLAARSGLTGPQLAVLKEIHLRRKAPIGTVAAAVQLTRGTVSDIASRLEQRGLLRRLRDGEDRRTVNVELTDAGRETLATAPPLLQDRLRTALHQLPQWQQNMTVAALQHIAEMMGPVPPLTPGETETTDTSAEAAAAATETRHVPRRRRRAVSDA